MLSETLNGKPPISWMPFWAIYSSPLADFKKIMLHSGSLVKILTPWPYYLISEPDLARHILSDDETLFTKKLIDYKIFENYVGRGILTKEGEQWDRINNLERPFFKKHHFKRQAHCIEQVLTKFVPRITARIKTGQPVDIGVLMARITFDIVAEYVFGVPNDDHTVCDYYEKMSMPKRKALSFFMPALPGKYRKENTAFQNAFTDYVRKMGRLAEKHAHESLYLSMKDRLEDDVLVNELKVLLFGGHTTLATLLTWVVYTLSVEPEAAEMVYGEIDAPALPHRPGEMAADTMRQSPLLRFVLETMRLYPPVWLIPRRCIKTHAFNGMTLKRGHFMLISLWTMNRNPAIWPHPDTFDPQRFEALTDAQRRAFMPFSIGKRQCMGKHFALLEARTILSVLLKHFRVRPSPKSRPNYASLISVKSADRISLYLERKNHPAVQAVT